MFGRIKSQARIGLKNNFGRLILATFIVALISLTASLLTRLPLHIFPTHGSFLVQFMEYIAMTLIKGVLVLIILLFFEPLNTGYTNLLLKAYDGESFNMESLFEYYKKNPKKIIISLFLTKLAFAGIIIGFIFAYGIVMSIIYSILPETAAYAIIFASMIPFVLFISIYILMPWGLLYYIVADEPEISASELIKKSFDIIKGHRWDMILFGLSFIGWWLLAGFIYSISFVGFLTFSESSAAYVFFIIIVLIFIVFCFWLGLYYSVAFAGYYRFLRADASEEHEVSAVEALPETSEESIDTAASEGLAVESVSDETSGTETEEAPKSDDNNSNPFEVK